MDRQFRVCFFLLILGLTETGTRSPLPADTPILPRTKVLVALRVDSDPIFTPIYVESIRRQVLDQLENSYGGLFDFEVVSSKHELIDNYRNRSIREPTLNELAGTESSSATATSFGAETVILIGLSHVRGQYRVTTRMLDALRHEDGVVRMSSTSDRQWVARGVCLEVKRRLPVAVTVTPGANAEVVQIEFPVHYDRNQLFNLLENDCVFVPYAVLRKRNGELFRQKLSLTFLHWQRTTAPGFANMATGIANVWSRRAGLVGFEAIRLDTQAGRVRIQVLQKDTDTSVVDVLLTANDRSFADHAESDILDRPDRRGVVSPRRLYKHLAFVRVTQGGGSVFKVPVPITGEITEQVVRIAADPLSRRKTEFDRELKYLVQDVQAITGLQEEAVKETNRLNSERQHEKAMSKATASLDEINPLLETARRKVNELLRSTSELEITSSSVLDYAKEQLGRLDRRQSELHQLRDALRIAGETRRQQDLANVEIKLAQQLELDGDIDAAIKQYEVALALQPKQPELEQLISKLKSVWRIKSPEHEEARKLVYQKWGKIDLTEIRDELPAMESCFATLRTHADYLAARKLAGITGDHLAELQAFVEQAANRTEEQERKEAEDYAQLLERLAQFQERVAQFVADSIG